MQRRMYQANVMLYPTAGRRSQNNSSISSIRQKEGQSVGIEPRTPVAGSENVISDANEFAEQSMSISRPLETKFQIPLILEIFTSVHI